MLVSNFNTIRLNGKHCSERDFQTLQENFPDPDLVKFVQEWFDDSFFITAFTSGSTGAPKKILLKKQHMVNSAMLTAKFFGLSDTTTALLCLPVNYIAGKMMVVRAFVTGLNLITVKPSSNPLKGITTGIDFIAMTPHQMYHSLNEVQQLGIKKIIVGGSELTFELEQQVKYFTTEIYETYGMTETCSHIALRKVNGTDPGAYFNAVDGVSFRKDEKDCLVIDAPAVSGNIVITNDVVELAGPHRFRLLGRTDNVINTGGIKVFPETVEKKIRKFISLPFFIGSLPDPALSEKVVLFIEKDRPDENEREILLGQLKETLPSFELPRDIKFISRFKYSQSNKLLRKETMKEIERHR